MSGSSLCRFVCGMSSKRNTRQTPEEPPVRCHHWTPYSIPLHTALRRFANPFRVASFGRADLTKFPWMSPVTCEGDTALVLADCDESMPLRISRLDPVVYDFCFVIDEVFRGMMSALMRDSFDRLHHICPSLR